MPKVGAIADQPGRNDPPRGRVAVGAIVVELVSAWAAVALGANRSEWTGGATGALIALLIISTVMTGKVIVDLHRAPRLRNPDRARNGQAADWLADVITVAERESHWLGPLCRPGLGMLHWIDKTLVSEARRHPLAAAAVVSGVFAVTVFGWQAIREQLFPSATVLEMGLGFCGMFAFLVVAGSYLGVTRSPRTLYGMQRRAVDACVVACIAAVGALAFRNSLWWIVRSNPTAVGSAQFALLVGSTTLLAFLAVFAAETCLRSHSRPAC